SITDSSSRETLCDYSSDGPTPNGANTWKPLRTEDGLHHGCAPSLRLERIHEIKHDGYRLMVRRDGSRVRCFTRGGHDWADRFPTIVEAALRIKAQSFLIDGEAVIARDDGTPDFHALRSKRRGQGGGVS